MNKCEWRDGRFSECISMHKASHRWIIDEIKTSDIQTLNGEVMIYCPFCGADIRKPEPAQPIIKKSGGTWVALYDDVDYLCVTRSILDNPKKSFTDYVINKKPLRADYWKPILEIEITDEIAKLRPLVIEGYGHLTELLLYVNDKGSWYTQSGIKTPVCSSIRLATVSDLGIK